MWIALPLTAPLLCGHRVDSNSVGLFVSVFVCLFVCLFTSNGARSPPRFERLAFAHTTLRNQPSTVVDRFEHHTAVSANGELLNGCNGWHNNTPH